jgi:predicted AlkP superfamily pyrophosphatase or phosphodiesterase
MGKLLLTAVLILTVCSMALAESLFIMGWDGAGMNNIVPLLEQGRLPNLKSIIDAGGCLTHIENISRTVTVPNWTEAWTGLTGDQTGVRNNFVWKRVLYENTIVKAIQDRGHNVGWFTSKTLLSSDAACTPLSSIALNANSYFMISPDTADTYIQTLSEKAIEFISSNTDYLIFLHVTPDYYGHEYGENSERYLQEFERADYYLGQILPHIDRLTTKVMVLSDHGFDEGKTNHIDAPDNFLVTDLPLKEFYCTQATSGTMRDIANTVLEYFGVDWQGRKPTMRGKSLLNAGP